MLKYRINQSLPDESSLRKKFKGILHKEVMYENESGIGHNLKRKSGNETTDRCGRIQLISYVGKLTSNSIIRDSLPAKNSKN